MPLKIQNINQKCSFMSSIIMQLNNISAVFLFFF